MLVINGNCQHLVEAPSGLKDLPSETKRDYSHKGCRCDNWLVDTFCRASCCDGIVGGFVGSLAEWGPPQSSQTIDPSSRPFGTPRVKL